MARNVVVYTMEGCPPCAMVKQLLTRMGVAFQVKDVGRDPAARQEFMRMGYRGTPVTLIDGQAIVGFDQARLMAALREAPGAKPPVTIVW